METQEDLEKERTLAKKVLKKVVKVRFSLERRVEELEANVRRNNTLCRFVVRAWLMSRVKPRSLLRWYMSYILIALLKILSDVVYDEWIMRDERWIGRSWAYAWLGYC